MHTLEGGGGTAAVMNSYLREFAQRAPYLPCLHYNVQRYMHRLVAGGNVDAAATIKSPLEEKENLSVGADT